MGNLSEQSARNNQMIKDICEQKAVLPLNKLLTLERTQHNPVNSMLVSFPTELGQNVVIKVTVLAVQ